MENRVLKDDRQGRVPYQYIQNIFANTDPIDIFKRSTIPYDEERNIFKIKLMGREYVIKHPEGSMYDSKNKEEIEAYTIKTLVLRYLVNSKAVPAFNKDITYKEIPGGLVYYPNFYSRTILKLAKVFSNNLESLKEGAEVVGGKKVNMGDAAYKFEFIDKVYITFIVWQGDEELSSSANILFDKNIEYYFNAEDLAVVGDVAIELIKHKGIIPKWIGLYQKKTKEGYEIN